MKTISEDLFKNLLSFCERNSASEGDEADSLYQELLQIQIEDSIEELNIEEGEYLGPRIYWLV